jgi:C4-type Zn-finger protein
MSKTADCPYCHMQAERVEEEVDIGAGTQVHFIGLDCTHCGHQVTACQGCGVWNELQEHRTGARTEAECIKSLSLDEIE